MTFCRSPHRMSPSPQAGRNIRASLLIVGLLAATPLFAQQSVEEPSAARDVTVQPVTLTEQPVNVTEQSARNQIVELAALAFQDQIAQAQPVADQPAPPSPEAQAPEGAAPAASQDPPGGKRVFGVLPNYRTADGSAPFMPISAKFKLTIAAKDSFDYPLVLLAAAFAGLGQLEDQHHQFGQGLAGFGRRLGTSYADQAIGNMMTEGFMPILLHEDPRYFRRGSGSKWGRTGYAVSRIFVTRTDSGGTRFNFSEWLGNATGVAISNLYYTDQRDFSDNATKLLEQCGTDAVSQILKEFWPDIKHRFFQKHRADH